MSLRETGACRRACFLCLLIWTDVLMVAGNSSNEDSLTLYFNYSQTSCGGVMPRNMTEVAVYLGRIGSVVPYNINENGFRGQESACQNMDGFINCIVPAAAEGPTHIVTIRIAIRLTVGLYGSGVRVLKPNDVDQRNSGVGVHVNYGTDTVRLQFLHLFDVRGPGTYNVTCSNCRFNRSNTGTVYVLRSTCENIKDRRAELSMVKK